MLRRADLAAWARECAIDLAGVTPAVPISEAGFYDDWISRGLAASMTYLQDHRARLRHDPRTLLESAQTVLCCGVLYNAPEPELLDAGRDASDPRRAWISRYAWGDDYHDILRRRLEQLAARLPPCEYRIAVDTAPLLERAYARRAGLGWIGKNTCLIHQAQGSWFFLGEILISLPCDRYDEPPPDRCGSCTRCIDACPTAAIVPVAGGGVAGPAWELDSRLCISFHTIESRAATPEPLRTAHGRHVFGCDICQDVCPWNHRAPQTIEAGFQARTYAPPLAELASLTEAEFRALFRRSPVWRAKYSGFLRNVAMAMGNAADPSFRAPLERLAANEDVVVRETAEWALGRIAAG